MHNGSWVSFCVGQWVMACDPLFTLMTMMTTITYVAYPVSGVKDAARARKDGRGSATSLQRVRSAATPVAADSPSHQLSLRNTVTTQRHATSAPCSVAVVADFATIIAAVHRAARFLGRTTRQRPVAGYAPDCGARCCANGRRAAALANQRRRRPVTSRSTVVENLKVRNL